jgi:hypothetical protein
MSQFTQQPQHPQGPQGPFPGLPHQAAAPAARNGLGVAALILGIVGILSGPVPFVFWLGSILGLLALILGLTGRRRAKRGEATNKGVATAGVVLGLLALILSAVGGVLTFKVASDVVNDISTSSTAKLDARESAIYSDGLTVTLSAPEPYSPTAAATGHSKGNKAYQVTLVIENARTKKYDATDVSTKAHIGANGAAATQITDGRVGKGFTGTVPPNRTVTVQLAFDTPPDAKTLTVEVHLGFGHLPSRWELAL